MPATIVRAFPDPAGIGDAGYSTHSTRRALEKFVQRTGSGNNWPGRDRHHDGEKQRFEQIPKSFHSRNNLVLLRGMTDALLFSCWLPV